MLLFRSSGILAARNKPRINGVCKLHLRGQKLRATDGHQPDQLCADHRSRQGERSERWQRPARAPLCRGDREAGRIYVHLPEQR